MIWEWTSVICILIGAVAGSLVTAVVLLDHHRKETIDRKWWEE